MVLDARCTTFSPPTQLELKILEEHEQNLKLEAAQIEAALDEQLENLEEANSGSETVNDYFTYSPSYHNYNYSCNYNQQKKTFLNVQTLPTNQCYQTKSGIEEALR